MTTKNNKKKGAAIANEKKGNATKKSAKSSSKKVEASEAIRPDEAVDGVGVDTVVPTANDVNNMKSTEQIDETPVEVTPTIEMPAGEEIADTIVTETTEEVASEKAEDIKEADEALALIETPKEEQADEFISVETKKVSKPKRKDITYVPLVGISYHYFRKFLKKQFNAKEMPVRFVRPETGYNGHIEVSANEKDIAMELVATYQTEHPEIKRLYWELAK